MKTVQEKAQDLIDCGKVTEVPVVRAFYVQGETDYLVAIVVVPPAGYGDREELLTSCTCPHGKLNNDPTKYCKHILGAVLQAARDLKERA